jgi:L-lactate dehydrogenase complex protein LldG
MFEQFKMRAEAVGAEVHKFKTRNEAQDFILQFLQKENVQNAKDAYAVWHDGAFLDGVDKSELSAKIPGLSFEVTRQMTTDAKVGISEMAYALTDTGSLVADQTSAESRLVSTLPAIHVALIGSDRILDGKPAVFQKINPSNSKYIAFITGPSRTADIERVLTIGVHGPKRLVIIFVDELGGAN